MHLIPENKNDLLEIKYNEIRKFKAIFPNPKIYATLLDRGAANLHITIRLSKGEFYWEKSIPFNRKSIERSFLSFEINYHELQAKSKEISTIEVLSELRAKGLLIKICQAKSYIEGGSPSGKEKALKLYREVIEQLSPESLSRLDNKLLEGANQDFRDKYNDNAIRKYKALFEPYYECEGIFK